MTPHRNRRRSGFTLLEMTAVMVILTILLAVGGSLIVSAIRVDATGLSAHQRLTGRAALADRFRTDVSSATTAPDRVGNIVAGPTTLLLEVRGGHVVYEWKEGRLERIEILGEAETRQTLPTGTVTTVEFVRSPLVKMRLTEPTKRGPTRFDVSAALRGDSQ